MGLHSLFCTQSNDVAIGLPIVLAIYPVAEYPANYPGYLVILSTLQVVAVNPVCITLLEWGKSITAKVEPPLTKPTTGPSSSKQPPSIALKVGALLLCLRLSPASQVFKGVVSSPLVIGSVVGVVINFSCGRDCLTSGVFGDCLTATAY